jgi:hypothetical protein
MFAAAICKMRATEDAMPNHYLILVKKVGEYGTWSKLSQENTQVAASNMHLLQQLYLYKG